MNKILFEKTLDSLKNIAANYKGLGENIYLVGGCVRDLQLGLTPKDIDLCIDYPDGVNLFMEYLQNNHSDICSGFNTFPRYGTSRFSLLVCGENVDIECVIPRIETYNQGPRKPDSVSQASIKEDAFRRDFCCNALYINLLSGELLDPTGYGIEDCKKKVLRTPLNPKETFIDDPLRMLRAVRFSVCKGFEILPEVMEKITDYSVFYLLSIERINDEFTKILLSDRPDYGIGILHDTGLLKHISSLLDKTFDFDQNSKYHHLTLGKHQLEVLKLVSEKRSSKNDIALRLAALFHDIGKLKNHGVKKDGNFSYHGHELDSAEIAETILKRLKYPVKVISDVKFLIQNHMCIKQFYDYSRDEYTGSSKVTRKILRTLGDYYRREMILIHADNMAHHPVYCMPGQVKSFKRKVAEVIESPIMNNVTNSSFTAPITGKDIMAEFKVLQGNLVGEIKSIMQDYYDTNPMTREELISAFRSEFSNKWIYAVLDSGGKIKTSLTQPEFDNSGNLRYNPNQLLPSGDDISRIGTVLSGDIYKLSAIKYPKLYRRLVRNEKGLKLLGEIGEKIDEIARIPEFSWLKIELENNDISMTIRWNDDTLTGIL